MKIKIISLNLSSLLIIFVLCTLTLSLSIGQNATFFSEHDGVFTHLYAGNEQQFLESPSQYFMCGFSFKRMRWGVVKNNCDCGRKWYRGRRRYRCRSCMNQFWSINNGIKFFFCHYKSWNLQIAKTFELPSSQPSQYLQTIMCPAGYYIRSFGPKFGHQEGRNLGLAGLSADCYTYNLVEHSHISDNSPFPISPHHYFVLGAFVSGAKVLYTGGPRIIGIYIEAEYMPVVTKIQISYLGNLNNQTSEIFDQQTVQNEGFDKIEKKISYTKKFSTNSIWNQKTLKTQGYHFQLSADVKVSLPSIALPREDSYQFHQSFNDTFNFNKQLMSTFEASENNLIMVPSCTTVLVKFIVNSQKGRIPFKAIVTFSGILSGARIIEKEMEGIWSGTYTSGTRMTLQRNTIQNCRSKNNNGRNNLRLM